MDVGRLAIRSLLLLAVAALVAGCAGQPQQSVDEGSTPANETTGETPGCIQEGQTGAGDGDIAADRACPGMTGEQGETTAP
ncbi:MAG TPA: hypothetical protein VNX21_09230 [Candidatus Thermoplasmatota archaeon]|nr:hypothetical protein [Candidatus Thermoplasmatota archaeon]